MGRQEGGRGGLGDGKEGQPGGCGGGKKGRAWLLKEGGGEGWLGYLRFLAGGQVHGGTHRLMGAGGGAWVW